MAVSCKKEPAPSNSFVPDKPCENGVGIVGKYRCVETKYLVKTPIDTATFINYGKDSIVVNYQKGNGIETWRSRKSCDGVFKFYNDWYGGSTYRHITFRNDMLVDSFCDGSSIKSVRFYKEIK